MTGYDVEKDGLTEQISTYFKPLPYKGYTFMEDRMKLHKEGLKFELPLMLLIRKIIKKLIEK